MCVCVCVCARACMYYLSVDIHNIMGNGGWVWVWVGESVCVHVDTFIHAHTHLLPYLHRFTSNSSLLPPVVLALVCYMCRIPKFAALSLPPSSPPPPPPLSFSQCFEKCDAHEHLCIFTDAVHEKSKASGYYRGRSLTV